MSYVIKLLELMSDDQSAHDGRYVVVYEPPLMDEHGRYSGGRLETSADLDKAKKFPHKLAAFEYWRQQNGLRPDGKPNRPLTGWTAEIEDESFFKP